MSAICGKLNFNTQEPVDESLISRMCTVQAHRGPDGSGTHCSGPVGLGHRRLAIIDREGGHQPLTNEDNTVWLVFDGIIGNHDDLRNQLTGLGHSFKTRTDAEVVLHGYEQWQEKCLDRLEGVFAFAIWDGKAKRLFLVRDHLGIKPIYFAQTNGSLTFATEIKAVIQDPAVEIALDPRGLNNYLNYLYVPPPRTMFKGIELLEPGHWLMADTGGVKRQRYWWLNRMPKVTGSYEEVRSRVEELLSRATKGALIGEVPVGTLVSGGIDSSSLIAMVAEHSSEPPHTFSIGFTEEDKMYDERYYASAVAKHLKTNHRELIVDASIFEQWPRLTWHLDVPVPDIGILMTYEISKFAKEWVTVLLSGVGGDELFCGYRRFLGAKYGRMYRVLPKFLRAGVIGPLARLLPESRSSKLKNQARRIKGLLLAWGREAEEGFVRMNTYLPDGMRRNLLSDDFKPYADEDPYEFYYEKFAEATTEGMAFLNRFMYADLLVYMIDLLTIPSEKTCSALGMEVRGPVIERKLVEYAAHIPPEYKFRSGSKKAVLKDAVRSRLPEVIFNKPKQGFDAPHGKWMRTKCRSMIEEALASDRLAVHGCFDPAMVHKLVAAHMDGTRDFTKEVLALYTFQLWYETFLARSREETGSSL